MPDFKKAFVPMPVDVSDAIEFAFERGEREVCKRRKMRMALSAAAVLAVVCGMALLTTDAIRRPKPDNVVAASPVVTAGAEEINAVDSSTEPGTEATVMPSVEATARPDAAPSDKPSAEAADPSGDGYRTLSYGDEGEDVRLLQKRLTELNYTISYIDGEYGNRVTARVEQFQEKNGLPVTGIADPETQRLLHSDQAIRTECDHAATNTSYLDMYQVATVAYCKFCSKVVSYKIAGQGDVVDDGTRVFNFSIDEFADRYESNCRKYYYFYDADCFEYGRLPDERYWHEYEGYICFISDALGYGMADVYFFNEYGVMGGQNPVPTWQGIRSIKLLCKDRADDMAEVEGLFQTLVMTTYPTSQICTPEMAAEILEKAMLAAENGKSHVEYGVEYAVNLEPGNTYMTATVVG